MSDTLQPPTAAHHPRSRYDGTPEVMFGVMALGFTAWGHVNSILPDHLSHGFAGMLVFGVGLLLLSGMLRWVPKVIQRRITWPRTGYVKYRVSVKPMRRVLVVAGVAAAVVGAGLAWLMHAAPRHDWHNVTWMVNAALYAGGYGFWISYLGLARQHPWKWGVLLGMVLGLVAMVIFIPAHFAEGGSLMLAFVGLAWLASGGATLYLFTRHFHPATPEGE